MLSDNRYTCQTSLPGFTKTAQAKIARAKVLVVGLGGLGCPAAQYLAGAGTGTLALADFDTISRKNLHRQILFGDDDIGTLKVEAAARVLQNQNPGIHVVALPVKITTDNVLELIRPYDIVLDCTDNFEARYLLNDACVLAEKPLVYGAAYQFQGQVAVWNAPNADGSRSPHYRDVFPAADEGLSVDCASGGVLPTLTGIIGCMQANEVIKYLAGLPGLLASKLLLFDARTMESRTISLPAASRIPVHALPVAVPTITPATLKQALPRGIYTLIDVRRPDEHDAFNIGGRLMPLSEITAGQAAGVDTEKPIVLYCATGRRSVVAARHIMRKHPTAQVFSLEGGVAAWVREPARR